MTEGISQFLYSSTYTDYGNTLQHNIETLMQGHMASSRDFSSLRSMEWCHLDDPNDFLEDTGGWLAGTRPRWASRLLLVGVGVMVLDRFSNLLANVH